MTYRPKQFIRSTCFRRRTRGGLFSGEIFYTGRDKMAKCQIDLGQFLQTRKLAIARDINKLGTLFWKYNMIESEPRCKGKNKSKFLMRCDYNIELKSKR